MRNSKKKLSAVRGSSLTRSVSIPTGIINFKQGKVTADPQMTAEEVLELVAAAKSFGRQTFAHASGDVGMERALEGGVDSIEHGFLCVTTSWSGCATGKSRGCRRLR